MSNHRRQERRFDIKLRYYDRNHNIDIQTGVSSPPSLTIKDIIHDAQEFLYLDDVPLKDIRLVSYEHEENFYEINGDDQEITLEELQITDDCILNFEPTANAAPPKLCHLKVIGPNETDKREFPWYRAKTTLNMLLEFVIKEFSLEFIERERIHLFSIIDELHCFSHSQSRLCCFDLHDGMSIYVQIIPALSSATANENRIIHIRCTCHETQFNLDIPITSTIEDIKRKIKDRFSNYPMIDFELYNDSNDELVSDDPNRTFEAFGVKPNETLYARFQLDLQKVQVMKQAQNRNLKYTQITIIYHLSSKESNTFSVSLITTIEQIIRKIEQFTQNQNLIMLKMCSNKIKIDVQQDRAKRLVDLGFQDDDVIDVYFDSTTTVMLNKQAEIDELKSTIQHSHEQILHLKTLINSRFMTSVLYGLAYIPQLTNFFLNDFHNSNNDDIVSAYAGLVRHVHSEGEMKKSSSFNELILRQAPHFTHFEHQDAKEFLIYLLDRMHRELIKQNITIIKDLFSTQSTERIINLLSIPLVRQERIFKIKFIAKNGQENERLIEVPMNGRVENILDEFSHTSCKPSMFYRLFATLPDGELNLETRLNDLPTDELILIEQETKLRTIRPKRLIYADRNLTLEDCLKSFFSKDNVLSRFPPILIIELARFVTENNLRHENQTFIRFPVTGLDFNKIIPSLEEETVYDLIAVNDHLGSIYDGHYTVSFRDFKTNDYPWFRLLASSIEYIEPDDYEYEIVSRHAYLLFYMKRGLVTEV